MGIKYEGQIWRPPSEARSLILQPTIGCSHNQCTFCVSYKGKRFRVRSFEDFRQDIDYSSRYYSNVQRIFLADGNALAIPTKQLLQTLNYLYDKFPNLERVSLYGGAQDILSKSLSELQTLRAAGLKIIYVGLESGDEEVLKAVKKNVTPEENIQSSQRVIEAQITLSPIIILGLGGQKRSQQHAKATAEMINAINPPFLAALTLMLPPGTSIYHQALEGTFQPLEPLDILKELRQLISGLKLSACIFRTNHASNYLNLKGTLSKDKLRLLECIDATINQKNIKPEFLRGL